MASGRVNRTQRPNTWLHRPSLRREDSTCQLGAVHTWHKCASIRSRYGSNMEATAQLFTEIVPRVVVPAGPREIVLRVAAAITER
jgi:hypothetical protein